MGQNSIGVFDSGVGGLSILREIHALLPYTRTLYFADQEHVPYGPRSMDEVRTFAERISGFLIEQGACIIVVACNTASAAALHYLRSTYPQVPFVGMEPAVKPAAISSQNRRVGVLATPATFQGELFASVVERFAQGVQVLEQTLPGLVEQIELGRLDHPETKAILVKGIQPLMDKGVDTLVLACTHYPLVVPLIQEIAGPNINVIDPAPAIARQTFRVWDQLALSEVCSDISEILYISTKDSNKLHSMALQLIHLDGTPVTACWREGQVTTTCQD
jgi:glutamate racemase